MVVPALRATPDWVHRNAQACLFVLASVVVAAIDHCPAVKQPRDEGNAILYFEIKICHFTKIYNRKKIIVPKSN